MKKKGERKIPPRTTATAPQYIWYVVIKARHFSSISPN